MVFRSSEFGIVDTWADIFARSGLKNHHGSLLALAEEHLEKHRLEKSIENFHRQRPAIVQTALNFVTGSDTAP